MASRAGDKVRILLVGAIRLYRDGLALVLAAAPGFEVVGSTADGIEAEEAVRRLLPDIVLLDVAPTGTVDAANRVRKFSAMAPVIALGVADLDAEIIRCAEAGVVGYVSREGSLETLAMTIHSAVRGEILCSPQTAGSMLRRLAVLSADRRAGAVGALTSREREILGLIDDGCSNKEIAARLGIEVATVKNHVHNLLEKLQVHRRAEAAARTRGQLPARPSAYASKR